MANYKRKNPKNTSRGGCLLCKPYKRVGCHSVSPRRSDKLEKIVEREARNLTLEKEAQS